MPVILQHHLDLARLALGCASHCHAFRQPRSAGSLVLTCSCDKCRDALLFLTQPDDDAAAEQDAAAAELEASQPLDILALLQAAEQHATLPVAVRCAASGDHFAYLLRSA
jgi:hypothetical protein